MPEIPYLYVNRVPAVDADEKPSYWVALPDATAVREESDDFGIDAMVALEAAYAVTKWSTPEPVDGLDPDTVLIGWAEAPITRDMVQRSYHQGYDGQPMVNIKVRSFEIPDGDEFAELVSEFQLDSRLRDVDLRPMIERFVDENFLHLFAGSCEVGIEDAVEDARSNMFPTYDVKLRTAGRQGGWLVVEGLPDVEHWGPDLLTAWSQFEKSCRGLADDVPRMMAWQTLANCQDELAGRVMRVQLTLTLSDEDLAKAGNDPADWDWRDLLNLSDGTEISIYKLD